MKKKKKADYNESFGGIRLRVIARFFACVHPCLLIEYFII